jgi:hypothetical protein
MCWNEAGDSINCADTGQDGDLQMGASIVPRFTDNLDGTVTDNLTGLIWLQDPIQDPDHPCLPGATWHDALSAANNLASGACNLADGSLPGTWRLPHINELMTLVNFGQWNPALTGSEFPWYWNKSYWSSTTYEASPDKAWYVYEGEGYTSVLASKGASFYVWPVRDGIPNPPVGILATGQTRCWDTSHVVTDCTGTGQDGEHQKGVSTSLRFVDNGDGTVTDKLTGLVWLKNASCWGTQDWENAVSDIKQYLQNGECGLSDGTVPGDWRLPNINELRSLVDFGQPSPPALAPGHPFAGIMPGAEYWSSTSRQGDGSDAWGVPIDSGKIDAILNKPQTKYLWPVRGGQ